MTKDSLKLLDLLKTAQITEDGNVFFCISKMTVFTVVEKGKPYREVDISKYVDSIGSILNSLSAKGFIESGYPKHEYIHVTHEGWHCRKLLRQEFWKNLMQSVLLPIIVSLITTLITLLLESWLSQIPQ